MNFIEKRSKKCNSCSKMQFKMWYYGIGTMRAARMRGLFMCRESMPR